jgi:hypothetical protein
MELSPDLVKPKAVRLLFTASLISMAVLRRTRKDWLAVNQDNVSELAVNQDNVSELAVNQDNVSELAVNQDNV